MSHQKLKKTSVKVSTHVNSANTIQYIIHLTWKRKNGRLNIAMAPGALPIRTLMAEKEIRTVGRGK